MPYDARGRYYSGTGRRWSMPAPPQPDYGEWLRQQAQRARDYWNQYRGSLGNLPKISQVTLDPNPNRMNFAPPGSWEAQMAERFGLSIPATAEAGRLGQRLGPAVEAAWEQMPRYQPPQPLPYLINWWGDVLQGEQAPSPTYLPMTPQGMGTQGMQTTQGMTTPPVTVEVHPRRQRPSPWNPWNLPDEWW